ncbi:MAG: histidine triad nucleotide-binding protein [Candidatus Hydrogenedentes bacterium]|nr:histidine triad nucleotide-binding protein [Candidatus Hydrogenedentota bacterium]
MEIDCLFCKIAAKAIPSTEVYSDNEFYAFRDINPGAPTHILIVPRKHIEKVTDVQPEDAVLLGKLVLKANEIAEKEGLTKDGFRYVINCGRRGGQTIWHVHLHILGGRDLAWPPG